MPRRETYFWSLPTFQIGAVIGTKSVQNMRVPDDCEYIEMLGFFGAADGVYTFNITFESSGKKFSTEPLYSSAVISNAGTTPYRLWDYPVVLKRGDQITVDFWNGVAGANDVYFHILSNKLYGV